MDITREKGRGRFLSSPPISAFWRRQALLRRTPGRKTNAGAVDRHCEVSVGAGLGVGLAACEVHPPGRLVVRSALCGIVKGQGCPGSCHMPSHMSVLQSWDTGCSFKHVTPVLQPLCETYKEARVP